MRRLRPVWWWRHRRVCKANAAWLEDVLAEADRQRTVSVTLTADTRQFRDALDRARRTVRGHRIRQALDAAEDFDAALRNLSESCGLDPADLEDFRGRLIDLTEQEPVRDRR